MIIRIEELPQGQTIKDISINISFDDGQIKNITNTLTDTKIESKEKPDKSVIISPNITSVQKEASIAPLEAAVVPSNINIPEIDLSNREHKVDSSMLDESF